MIKILFVCHGNICRSPMAEFVMRDLAEKCGLGDRFQIDSAAVSREELGNPVYLPVRKILAQNGIDCTGKTARQMTAADYDRYDYLIGMDRNNLDGMKRICGGDPQHKMALLLDACECPRDVADPWYTGGFSETWADVLNGCTGWLNQFRKGV